ncbi:collagen alpha-1(I) chain-like [Clupea harengus]|uniref:Collagen alpha-1(I) chain-like n=1 Tax=Clupea harengus TaxID=7950 RepID=A0A6P8F1V2_CLUHA|nr:collagen alpha-1(I) chain-like [Clupea harengus]
MFSLAYASLLVSASVLLVQGGVISTTICELQGKTYRDQERFQPEPCMSCICDNGISKCVTAPCAPVKGCPFPEVVPKGKCCPVCPWFVHSQMESFPNVPKALNSGRRGWE